MSDELGREELLKEAKEVFSHYFDDLRDYPSGVIVKQAYKQIVALIQQSEVDGEFVGVYVKMIKEDPHQCTRENLIGMLREAGVKVIID